ncbi:MAG: hypothetical protein Q4G36_08275 [Paracoccus sp. (in: a-proteobacteria)]|nr:hypothetical protein [Paracoccus sp. (in: a-proteobacteria)]
MKKNHKISDEGLNMQAGLDRIKAAAAIPTACGPDIAPAPARGGFVLVRHVTMVPSGQDAEGRDQWSAAQTGYGHRTGIRCADVFDQMIARAEKARVPWLLTPGQIAVARHYRSLTERHAAGGIKLSQMDRGARGGDGREFMDAFLAEGRELAAIHRRIGGGVSMAVRRVRPSVRGARSNILDRVLVDQVCLGDRTVAAVLRLHGWSVNKPTREAAIAALCASLDRMIGYRGQKTY